MDLGINGKTAIFLGSSRGIGLGVGRELLQEKAHIVICSRNQKNLETAVKELEGEFSDSTIRSFRVDISMKDEMTRLMEFMEREVGTTHMILNKTGGPLSVEFLKINEDMWENSFQSLLMSTVRLVHGMYPYMSREGCSIVNILSRSARMYLPNLVLSNTFGSAIAGLAKTLSIELAQWEYV